jgi:hypothetical protein
VHAFRELERGEATFTIAISLSFIYAPLAITFGHKEPTLNL